MLKLLRELEDGGVLRPVAAGDWQYPENASTMMGEGGCVGQSRVSTSAADASIRTEWHAIEGCNTLRVSNNAMDLARSGFGVTNVPSLR